MEEMTMMKALVRDKFGGPEVVRVGEVEQPALEDDRVLVRVRAS
jgi:NADPH:quinone reductase-like Zn-dependent oxidoreductase